jgi:GNAT superfamily N-acetyltransferase
MMYQVFIMLISYEKADPSGSTNYSTETICMDHLFHKLDNPAFHSLNETHSSYSINFDGLNCYHPDYCPFGGSDSTDIANDLNEYSKVIDNFYIIGEKPNYSQNIILKKELLCLQMTIDHRLEIPIREEIRSLNGTHEEELFDLVNLVQPGYFRRRTAELGDYFGIFKQGKLVAASGERMKMHDFTEVSAIVTHPDHTGKGYAKQLIAHTVNRIFDENKIPFLHVAESNSGAIRLYEHLGFRTRRKISFWNFVRS